MFSFVPVSFIFFHVPLENDRHTSKRPGNNLPRIAARIARNSASAASASFLRDHAVICGIGVQYKTAWHLCHRIRKAMEELNKSPFGGQGQIVEVDESFIGSKKLRKGVKAGKDAKISVLGMPTIGSNWRRSERPR